MKKTLLAIALAAATTTAYADTSVSGHVNYTAGDLEDFNGNEDFSVSDALTSQSRFRIKASKEAGGITYGITEEFGLNTGATSTDDTENQIAIRVNEFYLKGAFGKLSLGQGSEVGDGKSEKDFSGTYVLNNAGYNSWEGAGITQIDGGRDERLRYDSPKLGGIATISLDYDNNDDVSIAVDLGGSNWAVGAYAEDRDANDSDEFGLSGAVKFAGVTLALQYGEQDGATSAIETLEFARFIAGYRAGAFSVAIDAATNERDGGVDTETVGLSFVYRPTKGVELYAGLRESTDNNATSTASVFANNEEDASGFLLGGRVKF